MVGNDRDYDRCAAHPAARGIVGRIRTGTGGNHGFRPAYRHRHRRVRRHRPGHRAAPAAGRCPRDAGRPAPGPPRCHSRRPGQGVRSRAHGHRRVRRVARRPGNRRGGCDDPPVRRLGLCRQQRGHDAVQEDRGADGAGLARHPRRRPAGRLLLHQAGFPAHAPGRGHRQRVQRARGRDGAPRRAVCGREGGLAVPHAFGRAGGQGQGHPRERRAARRRRHAHVVGQPEREGGRRSDRQGRRGRARGPRCRHRIPPHGRGPLRRRRVVAGRWRAAGAIVASPPVSVPAHRHQHLRPEPARQQIAAHPHEAEVAHHVAL
ncbi:conserved hypothetical protein, partial [Ricinus communis]